MRQLSQFAVVISSAFVLTACGSAVKLDEKAKIEERTPISTTATTTDSRSVGAVDATRTDPLNDPNSQLAARSVYFDLDSFIVKDEFKPVVNTHSQYLHANKGRKIIIQGNTDERGSREYNLALGQKRAEAVRKSLSVLGVNESQMEAVSLGEEKPRATGNDEAAFAENRRADIVY